MSAQFQQNNFKNLLAIQQKYYQETWKQKGVKDRLKVVRSVRNWIKEHQEEIVQALDQDLGKPKGEALLNEIRTLVGSVRNIDRNLAEWVRTKKVSTPLGLLGARSEVRYESKGVVLIIAPWNFPFMLCIGPLVAALAAGNCAVLKPSEMTPNTSALLSRMISDLFPPEFVSVVEGEADVAQQLTALPFDHIFFTGSPQVGRYVMKAAAENLTPVTLELGGCNPLIVDETVNVKTAAKRILWSKFLNTGQSCVSINNLFVHESKYESLKQALLERIEEHYQLLPSNDPLRTFGRIVNEKHARRVANLFNDAVAAGAEVLTGGEFPDGETNVPVTVLGNVAFDNPILTQEIFGPILPLVPYQKLEDVLEHIEQNPTPLACYLFTKKAAHRKLVANRVKSGTLVFNDSTMQFTNENLPFGGIGESGMGNAHGKWGVRTFMHERSVMRQRWGFTTLNLIYPPYKGWRRKLWSFFTWKL